MKVGGNQKAREFFEGQRDYKPNWSIHDKYNSRAAALLRDKVSLASLLFILLYFSGELRSRKQTVEH